MKDKSSNQNTVIPLSVAKEPTFGNEDACNFQPNFGLLAIADGASNGSTLTSFWSNLLVNSFCELPYSRPCEFIRDRPQEWLEPLQAQWQEKYKKMLHRKEQNNNCKLWNPSTTPQAKRNAKGAATFLGVHILPTDKHGRGMWQAIAIGDSCVFQFRRQGNEYKKLEALPLTKSQDFSIKTEGLTSRLDMSIQRKLLFYEYEYYLNDIFLLATDAFSEWLLKSLERGSHEWQNILEIEDRNSFEKIVTDLRDRNEIVYDDTTFCRIEVISSPQEWQGTFIDPQPLRTIPTFEISDLISGLKGKTLAPATDSIFNRNSTADTNAPSKPTAVKTVQLPQWAEHVGIIILVSILVLTFLYFPYREVSSKLEEISRALSKLSSRGTQTSQAYTLTLPTEVTEEWGKRVSVKQIVNGKILRNTLLLNERHQSIFNSASKVCFWVEIPDKYFRLGSRGLVEVPTKLRIWRCNGHDKPRFQDAAGELLPGTYLLKGDRSFSAVVPYDAQFRTVEFYPISKH